MCCFVLLRGMLESCKCCTWIWTWYTVRLSGEQSVHIAHGQSGSLGCMKKWWQELAWWAYIVSNNSVKTWHKFAIMFMRENINTITHALEMYIEHRNIQNNTIFLIQLPAFRNPHTLSYSAIDSECFMMHFIARITSHSLSRSTNYVKNRKWIACSNSDASYGIFCSFY